MVPDPSLTIRQRAIAAWPPAWGGQNQRDILVTLGYDVDRPWGELTKKDRNWILFTNEQPTVPVYAGYTPQETQRALKRKEEPSYQGTFTGVRPYLLQTLATTESSLTRNRVLQYLISTECQACHGKRLRPESLSVTFEGLDIAEISALPLVKLHQLLQSAAHGAMIQNSGAHPERLAVAQRIAADLVSRIQVMLDLGLGYLALDRSTPTLSPGELQRLRLATQVHSNLFGVVYVLDEPSAGLHPADTEALLRALDRLKSAGNSLFVVEHEMDVIRRAEWIVDVGPLAGEEGGHVLYSGPPAGLKAVEQSKTRSFLFEQSRRTHRTPRTPRNWLRLEGVSLNNLKSLAVAFPIGTLTCVTGVSGSGKSSLVSHALIDLVSRHLGHSKQSHEDELEESALPLLVEGRIVSGMEGTKRLVQVDQKPIGRTPRSNLATYTGLFDQVRKLFAATKAARARKYTAGRFSFNVAQGRCEACQGEGFICVELLFMPSVYAPCATCGGTRYNAKTLEIQYGGKNIAEVLAMTVGAAAEFFAEDPALRRALSVLQEVGLSYLRLGQPATELSGGEAQRIKLATELQRLQSGHTLYVLDEPTTGLHPSDVQRLNAQLNRLVDAGNTVIVVEHDLDVIALSDYVIDVGPGAGEEGGQIVALGTPLDVARSPTSRTAPYLDRFFRKSQKA